MQKFEYRSVPIDPDGDLEEVLNGLGEEGWDLVTVPISNAVYPVWVFKRPKEEPKGWVPA